MDVRLVHRRACSSSPRLQHADVLLMNLQTVEEVQRGAEAIAENYKHSMLESREQYDAMYKQSIEDPDGFWSGIAKGFHWEKQVSLHTTSCVISQLVQSTSAYSIILHCTAVGGEAYQLQL